MGILDLFDYVTANVLLPLGGVLIAVFAGWIMRRSLIRRRTRLGSALAYRAWLVLIRFVAPAGVILVFLHAIGLI
jgi:NSS family neurotransmitter:Na+ symporter